MNKAKRDQIIRELATVINRHSLENLSDTPDFILAEHLMACLEGFSRTSKERDRWHEGGTLVRNQLPLED